MRPNICIGPKNCHKVFIVNFIELQTGIGLPGINSKFIFPEFTLDKPGFVLP